MKELSKSIVRRMGEPNFARRWFVGAGLDIGGKPDPLSLYVDFFPLMTACRVWDWEDGDAQDLAGVAPRTAWISSTPATAWSICATRRIGLGGLVPKALRPGGFLVITVPDEDLYEQGVVPAQRRSTATTSGPSRSTRQRSWSERSINLHGSVVGPGRPPPTSKRSRS